MISLHQIKAAYKKLKAGVYYDKTQLVLRREIVKYENTYKCDAKLIEQHLDMVLSKLNESDNVEWENYISRILDSIGVLYFPKEIASDVDNVVINDSPNPVSVKKLQKFINIEVDGQVLGILWVMTVGRILDKEIYPHSYGNRLKKHASQDSDQESYSPFLFQPYFSQYESWRDKALDIAIEVLDKKQDVIILTMDFSRFFYNVHISEHESAGYYMSFVERHGEDKSVERLNDFVYKVLKLYSKKNGQEEKVFLPIGFFPSNILSNYCLKDFDEGIIKRWNPLYYGRYVDDIILVDKVEKNSPLYLQAKKGDLSNKSVMSYFLCDCNAVKSKPCCASGEENRGLLIDTEEKDEDDEPIFAINHNLLGNKETKILVKNKKVKVFYFKESGSRALLDSFKKTLYKNISEFRYLPEDDAVLVDNDYSEIFDLKNSDTINKLRSVEGIGINKYAMSKFLGKLMRIGGLVYDPAESKFEKDILRIFDARNIIDNYTTWDKIIQILITNLRFQILHKYINAIIVSILGLKLAEEDERHTLGLQKSLLLHLHTSLCRGLSLVWRKSVKEFIEQLCIEITGFVEEKEFSELASALHLFNYNTITEDRRGYCYSRMCDKYAMISSVDFIVNLPRSKKQVRKTKYRKLSDKIDLNLTQMGDFLKIATFIFDEQYCYFPFVITPQDLSFAFLLSKVCPCNKSNNIDAIGLKSDILNIDPIEINKYIKKEYIRLNFNNLTNVLDEVEVIKVNSFSESIKGYATRISTEKTDKFDIAIANVKLNESDFEGLLVGLPNRTYKRYRELARVFNEALREKADMLVFPESYLPLEWLPVVARTCAKNQLALVAGIEHFLCDGKVFNITATVLPYEKDGFRFSHIAYHLKVHYSPEEDRQIRGYRLKPISGRAYDLFIWRDLWFPVYCCFELASISDRSLFMNYSDLFVAVEWNKDTTYFSSIIESLCRDMHCYCVQVNSSDYGDSRVLQPSELAVRDIVKTKGGLNNTILVARVDIHRLRSFQIKEYELQKDEKFLKATPPQFDKKMVFKKIKGVFWEEIF